MYLNFDKATLDDALFVAHYLRPSDREECSAHTTEQAEKVLTDALQLSSHAWAIRNDKGLPVGIFGVCPAPGLEYTGIPWLLCTTAADKMPKAFARYTQGYLDMCHSLYPKLINFVPSTSTKTLAWLKRLGFTLGNPIPSPKHKGVQLTPFYKEKSYV